MEKREKAANLFREGYNCAQSVVLAFSEEIDLDKKTEAMLSSSFGGGMGRLREVCGAVSGMFILVGLIKGYDKPNDDEAKAAHYALIQRLAEEFRVKNGSIICRELLGLTKGTDDFVPEKRTESYYAVRPCEGFVADAVEILDHHLREQR